MYEMILPYGVEFIINRLESRGYCANVVGGSVRDFLRGVMPHDYDITTDASPEEMKAVFSDVKTIETGIKHGTLTVLVDSVPYEVTTYRLDGEYSDNRHPDNVVFTKNLSDDLSRRDFTMNAIAYNKRDGITDVFGGCDDISKRVIRAVGEPERRFSEDALRILRALRFASVLNFEIEPLTAKAIFRKKELLRGVSAERIMEEWKKLISGVAAHRILSQFSSVIEVFLPELAPFSLPDTSLFESASPLIREAGLFYINSISAENYSSAMMRLKSDNKRRLFVKDVISFADEDVSTDEKLNLLLIKCGKDCLKGVLELKCMLKECNDSRIIALNNLINSGCVYQVSHLDVRGNDIISLGISGKDVGACLDALLISVVRGKTKNQKSDLLETAKSLYGI